jgi:hypothetical protein
MNFEHFVKPAILMLLQEADDSYRCEGILHHHVTLCLNEIRPLRLGRRDRLVWPEQPTTAKYSWRGRDRRAGNADYFLAPATAIELNHGYTDHDKIKQDFIKLLDPQNGYHEAIYFVYGKPRFRAAVQAGLTKALQFLAASQAVVIAGCPLHVLVVETQRQRSRLWEATMAAPFLPDTLLWTEVFLTTVEERSHANGLANQGTTTRQELHIAREEATSTHDAKMIAAGIPLRSTAARCMFPRDTR